MPLDTVQAPIVPRWRGPISLYRGRRRCQHTGLTATSEHLQYTSQHRHGGDFLPLLDECDRIAALVREENARHRAASCQMAREVAATAEQYLGKWWDDNEYGESVLDEATQRFLNGGEVIDY